MSDEEGDALAVMLKNGNSEKNKHSNVAKKYRSVHVMLLTNLLSQTVIYLFIYSINSLQ